MLTDPVMLILYMFEYTLVCKQAILAIILGIVYVKDIVILATSLEHCPNPYSNNNTSSGVI